jgi:predicted deacylase
MMAPLMMLRRQPPVSRENGGMIWYDAKVQGKITIGTEWGGGGMSHAAEYESIFRGVENSLRQLGVLVDGKAVATREGLGLEPTVISLHRSSLDYILVRRAAKRRFL